MRIHAADAPPFAKQQMPHACRGQKSWERGELPALSVSYLLDSPSESRATASARQWDQKSTVRRCSDMFPIFFLRPCAPRSSTPNWLARVRSYQLSGLGRQFPPPSRQSCPIHRFARLYWACARERAGAPRPVSLLPHSQGDERDDLLPRTHAPCLSSSVVKAMLDEACCSSTLEPP